MMAGHDKTATRDSTAFSKPPRSGQCMKVDEEYLDLDEKATRFIKRAHTTSRLSIAGLTCAFLIFLGLQQYLTRLLYPLKSIVPIGTTAGQHGDSTEDICLTPACIHASSSILYNLSPDFENLDPCTNFEELVCGGWRDRNDLRPDQGEAFTGTVMYETSQQLLRHILEVPYPKGSSHSEFSPRKLQTRSRSADEENFDKLQAAYDACLDEETIKKVGIKPLAQALNETAKIFKQSKHHSALSSTFLHLASLGVTALFDVGTTADDKDPDSVVVAVSAPYRFGLPAKEYYDDEKILKKYEQVVSQVIPALTSDFDRESNHYRDVVAFEKQLAAASPDAEDRDDVEKYYNPISLDDADKIVPQVQLAKIVSKLAPKGKTPEGIILMAPQYMKNLTDILSDTPEEVVLTYMLWKQVQSYASYIEADAVTPLRRFSNELSGKDPDSVPERWRNCVGHVNKGLGWILSRFFVEKAFSAEAKVFGDQIVHDIKDQFIETLKVTEWMEDSVKELAIRKVHNIVQKIGYPDKSPDIMNPETLQKYYKKVDVSSSAFFENVVSMTQRDIASAWSSLGKPVDRDEWDMTVPTVNAYYNPPGNEIVFPAGIMQFPVFDVNLPQYVSYGAFGSVSGHELSHAFDSTGRHYDQNGNYTDWWTKHTVEGFKERAECFVAQYHDFTIEGPDDKPLHINGRLTLGENIADAGGVSAAFKAWKKRATEKPNAHLPGLESFTQDQLFFVSYANWWCGKSRKQEAINRVYTDPHSPLWARVLGTMANSRAFKESFQCAQKEPVCELW